MTGHYWHDKPTAEATVDFLIAQTKAGKNVDNALDKIKGLNSHQIRLHKEFDLSKELIQQQYRAYTTTTGKEDLNFMRKIPKSWDKEDAFKSIKGLTGFSIDIKLSKIQEYKERFKVSCNTSELCLSKCAPSLGNLFNEPDGPMKTVAEFLTETPGMLFSRQITEVDQPVSPSEKTPKNLLKTRIACTIS